MKKKKALYALALLILFGSGLMLFILAANEQVVLSSGSPTPEKTRLQNLVAQRPAANQHMELVDFYFGKNYIYAAKLVQFRDVYLPVFPEGAAESGAKLQVLIWIRNDRNSNQRLIESEQDLNRFVSEFNQHPRPLSGVLRKPTERVRTLTAEAYPGTNLQSLEVLWARDFPTQESANVLWTICAICFVGAGICAVAYRRQSRSPAAHQPSQMSSRRSKRQWSS